MEYTVQNLEYAVSVFYNGEQQERAKAHTWLTTAQRVPEAWTFVWDLLQPSKATEIQFFGATTLHTKILRCWNEIPPESHDALKEKLLQAVFLYSNGPKMVTNRLCISVAAFILQQGANDLATILRPLSSAENMSLLLEVLTVIPEEYNSMTMGSALRSKNRIGLQQACPAVLDDMLRYLQAVDTDFTKEGPSEATLYQWLTVAACANSWLSLGGEDNDCTSLPSRLPLCNALHRIVEIIYTWNPCVSDSALEACEACLTGVRAAGYTPHAGRHPVAALQLLGALTELASPILARDNVPNSINEELLSSLITCVVAIGECHSATIVKALEAEPQDKGALDLIEILLAAQAAPGHYPIHETRSNLMFGFWYTLQDEVLNLGESSDNTKPIWRSIFSRLLTALVTKSEAPPDGLLTRVDLELLRCYRQDVADTVMYCFAILGDYCWTTVEEAYLAADTAARREAALHVFLALADAAPHERAPAGLVSMLHHATRVAATERDKLILNTALDCLGSYAAWLASVGSSGTELSRAMLSAGGAGLSAAPARAALALRRLCADCSSAAAHLAPSIAAAALSPQGKSDTWVRRQLLGAAGAALAAAEAEVALPLLTQIAEDLQKDLNEQVSHPENATGIAECASAFLAAVAPSTKLTIALCNTILPTLPPYSQNETLIEPMFVILKQVVTTLIDDCAPIANEIAQLTMNAFNVMPCGSGLDLVKLFVIGIDGEWSGTGRLLHACVSSAASAVKSQRSNCPDLDEGLFLLLSIIVKKKPNYLDAIDDLLPELIKLGCETSCVSAGGSVSGAARAACAWLCVCAALRPRLLLPHAPDLTARALHCIGGGSPRNQIQHLAELLLCLNRASWPAGNAGLGAWLRIALAPNGFPTPHATDAHKMHFINAVLREKTSKRRILESVQEFSLVCRGLVGTEYARQAIASKQLVT